MSSEDNGGFPLDATYGAFMIGVSVSLVLYGLILIQAVNYFKYFPNDNLAVKLTVVLILVVETCNSAFQSSALYHFVVTHRGDPAALSNPPWQLNAPISLNASSGTIVQLFFARRVWIMSDQRIWLTALIVLLSLSQLALSWAIGILAIMYPTDTGKFINLNIPAFTLTAACDIVIACSLVFFLQIRKSGHAPTNTLVNRLIFLTVNNGAMCSVIAFVALVTIIVAPMTMAPYAICFTLAKTYAATLLTSLNTRRKTRTKLSRSLSAVDISRGSRRTRGEQIKLQEQSFNRFGEGSGITITRETTVS